MKKEKEIRADERLKILRMIIVYQNMFHFSTKEYKLLEDVIKKI